MRIIVIGLGSMGKRRIRLIREIYSEYDICGVDSRKDRQEEAYRLFGIECFSEISEVTGCIDCAFVCTSPLSHARIIKECLTNKWNVFTELNLVHDGYDENISLARTNGCILFLSSTFLYREETRYIHSRVDSLQKWNYIYHVGQYLPDWHPWENFREFFIGEKRTNGCREIMAIELPWLTQTFGQIGKVEVLSDNISGLNIDYKDNFMIQITHRTGNKGVLIVDVVSPVAIRDFHAYTEGRYISWRGTPESILEFDRDKKELVSIKLIEDTEHEEGYGSFIIENAYKNEIKEFFDVVVHGKNPLYGFEQDQVILDIIDTIGA